MGVTVKGVENMMTRKMTAKERKGRTLSEWGAREAARMQGIPVSHEQFHSYLDTGLLPPPNEKGRWEPNIAEMLLTIRALGETVRPLPRRLIRLYGHRLFDHITREQVYTAALEVGRGMDNPNGKMGMVDAAMQRIAPVHEMAPNDEMLQEVAKKQAQQPPTHEEWLGALRLGLPLFTERVEEWRAWAGYLLHANVSADGSPIPYEELVTLIAGWYLFHMLKLSARHVGMQSMPEVFGRILLEETPAQFARALAEDAA